MEEEDLELVEVGVFEGEFLDVAGVIAGDVALEVLDVEFFDAV